MAAVAAVGLLANLAILWVLNHEHSLNARSAFLHVFSDTISSRRHPGRGGRHGGLRRARAGSTRCSRSASPALILWGATRLIMEITDILMESVPRHIDVVAVSQCIGCCPGVLEVHDLHVWTISSGLHALSAHVVVRRDDDGPRNDAILDDVKRELRRAFGIDHTTLQIESSEYAHVYDSASTEARAIPRAVLSRVLAFRSRERAVTGCRPAATPARSRCATSWPRRAGPRAPDFEVGRPDVVAGGAGGGQGRSVARSGSRCRGARARAAGSQTVVRRPTRSPPRFRSSSPAEVSLDGESTVAWSAARGSVWRAGGRWPHPSRSTSAGSRRRSAAGSLGGARRAGGQERGLGFDCVLALERAAGGASPRGRAPRGAGAGAACRRMRSASVRCPAPSRSRRARRLGALARLSRRACAGCRCMRRGPVSPRCSCGALRAPGCAAARTGGAAAARAECGRTGRRAGPEAAERRARWRGSRPGVARSRRVGTARGPRLHGAAEFIEALGGDQSASAVARRAGAAAVRGRGVTRIIAGRRAAGGSRSRAGSRPARPATRSAARC